MTVFFVDWELWQEMTFVLACCIVTVFFIGTLRLWWMTRAMRKHEVIDEEKRARVTEMRHCGINVWRADEIPFGVRALQTGVKVDGIWISRSDPAELSQVASSATLIEGHFEEAKGKNKWHDSSSDTEIRQRHTSEHSTIDQLLNADLEMHHDAGNARDHIMLVDTRPVGLTTRGTTPKRRQQDNDEVLLYLPTGWQSPEPGLQPSYHPQPRPGSHSSNVDRSTEAVPSILLSTNLTDRKPPSEHISTHATTANRRLNEDSEVRPPGSFAAKAEVREPTRRSSMEELRLPHFQPGPAKLRKKGAPKQGNLL